VRVLLALDMLCGFFGALYLVSPSPPLISALHVPPEEKVASAPSNIAIPPRTSQHRCVTWSCKRKSFCAPETSTTSMSATAGPSHEGTDPVGVSLSARLRYATKQCNEAGNDSKGLEPMQRDGRRPLVQYQAAVEASASKLPNRENPGRAPRAPFSPCVRRATVRECQLWPLCEMSLVSCVELEFRIRSKAERHRALGPSVAGFVPVEHERQPRYTLGCAGRTLPRWPALHP